MSGFRARRRVDVAVHRVDRDVVRTAHRRFRATDGFEVIVAEQVIERAVAIGRAREPMEWMGLLVGRVCEDAAGSYACVLGMVLDREARAGRHEVTSTPESEAATRALARELLPDCVALGWIHGHIRHGVHFSAVDRENQRTWRQPYAVGIVVDPWSPDLLSVYRGPGSERLAPTAESTAPAHPHAPDPAIHDRPPGPRRTWSWRTVLCALLAFVASMTGYAAGTSCAVERRVDRLEQQRESRGSWRIEVLSIDTAAPPPAKAPGKLPPVSCALPPEQSCPRATHLLSSP
ncbi:MAG: hypothetical protein JWM10_757 [Myxococcaceae bacterium]|nr:hypothetical protein [Myxococcaceae bacterium]